MPSPPAARRRRAGARLAAGVAVVAAATSALAGCRSDEVRVAFRAPPGATISYEIDVRTRIETDLAGLPSSITHDDVRLVAHHRVLASTGGAPRSVGGGARRADGEGARIEVTVERAGSPPRVFVARLDRLGRLAGLEGVAPGLADLGLGLAELFPAGAAPPSEELRPGARWPIEATVEVPGRGGATVLGTGRLESLGVVDGRHVARLRSRLRVPVDLAAAGDQRVRLDGLQQVELLTEHDLADGVLRRSEATTWGTFAAVLAAPEGSDAPPVTGEVRVEVRSTTTRLR